MSRPSFGLNAGRLRDLVPFELKTWTVNANGQNVGTWDTGFSEWCEVRRQSEQSCQFIMRFREGISPATHRALFFDSIWTIVNVVPDIRRTMLIIDCDFSSLIEVTHMQSTTKEFIEGLPTVARPE